ncbi:MAG: ATP-binding protein, partial [Thermoplasmata archaeon]|nr:ATP-binding protein [Thermoplasmata archaeon]
MPRTATLAENLAAKQREISVAEFFERNRQILGFDNPVRALLTTVKEGCDNALDASEEASVLPDIQVEITKEGVDRLRVAVSDNGPGILSKQIPNVFGRLLYGSRFHANRQSRGQQGIGISAAVLYAALTTARPARI